MPWFRLDDSFHSHQKVIQAGNEAIGLYTRCGTYASQHLTDGFIAEHVALLYGSAELAETLVRARLWRRVRGGWQMPDYLDYNPSREAVEKERKLKAERQRRWLEARKRRGRDASIDASKDDAPDPPRPEGKRGGKPAPSAGGGRANPPGSPPPEKPPWCGQCDERSRQIEVGESGVPAQCPNCHPLASLNGHRGRHARQEPKQ